MVPFALPDYLQLLPADVQNQFRNSRLPVRGLFQGERAGSHRSPRRGSSAEFKEHREYSPGDDLRNLDWRVFGRLDRSCVKQYVEESSLRAWILLDNSGSMRFSSTTVQGGQSTLLSKLDYARRLAALFAFLCVRQGDAVGLIQFDSAIRSLLAPQCSLSHLRRLLQALHSASATGASGAAAVLNQTARQIPRRGVVIVISDLLGEVSDLVRALHHLRHQQHEVLLFHVLTDEELTFPFHDAAQFRDMEGMSRDLEVHPQNVRQHYLQQLAMYLQALEDGCRRVPVDYVRFRTSIAPAAAFSSYLADRTGSIK